MGLNWPNALKGDAPTAGGPTYPRFYGREDAVIAPNPSSALAGGALALRSGAGLSLAAAAGSSGALALRATALVVPGAAAASTTGALTIATTPATVQDEGSDLPRRTKLNFVGAGVTATDDLAGDRTTITIPGASGFQPLDATLTALAAYNTNGLVVQTAADTFTGRTITGTTGQIAVANGDGVAGNPTISLPATITQAESISVASGVVPLILNFASGFNASTGTDIGLQVQAGNTSGTFTNAQIAFGYNGTATFRQALRTRHQASSGAGNAFDFYLWNQAVDASSALPSIRALTINTGSVAGEGYVGINQSTPAFNLDVTGTGRFTGVLTVLTASGDTNTTQAASTAFVIGQASASNPVMDGAVAIGTSLKYARADHVHASDTSRQPVDPTLTALAAYNTNGVVVQTAADTFAGRTIVGTTNYIVMTNGDGVAGNPTINIGANVVTTDTNQTVASVKTFVGADGSAQIALKSNTALSTESSRLDFSDNQASPQHFYVRKVGTELRFEGNAGTKVAGVDSSGNFDLAAAAQYRIGGTQIAASNLSNGTTGSGSVVLAGSPTLTGTPLSTTAAVDTNTTQIATTAYVVGQGYLKSATAAATYQPLDATLTALAAYNTNGLVTQTAADTFTGRTLTGDTEIVVTNGNGVSGNPTLSIGAAIARIASPAFTGNPTAPTPAANDNDTSIATTAYVQSELTAYASDTVTFTNKTFTDSTTLLQDDGDNTKKLAFQLSGITTGTTRTLTIPNASGTIALTADLSAYQPLDPTLTALAAYNTNGLLTQTAADTFTGRTITGDTEIVVSNGNGVSGNPTLSIGAAIARLASPTFTGTPAAPTAAPGTNTTQLATTAFVAAAITAVSGYATIQEEGGALTQRTTLNFIGGGITAADDGANTRTNVTLDATLNSLAAYNTNGLIVQTAADTFTGRTIAGTTNRLAVTNGDGVAGNPTLDISASYVGQASITTLGTITTGTWQGTAVDSSFIDQTLSVGTLTASGQVTGAPFNSTSGLNVFRRDSATNGLDSTTAIVYFENRDTTTSNWIGYRFTTLDASLGLRETAAIAAQVTARGATTTTSDLVFKTANAATGGVETMRLTGPGQLALPATGTAGGLLIGGDTTLYRSTANVLTTDDTFSVGASGDFFVVPGLTSPVRSMIQYGDGTGYYLAFGSRTGTPAGRGFFRIFEGSTAGTVQPGRLEWSDNAASPSWDTNLYRSAADTLKTDDTFNAVLGYQVNGTALAASHLSNGTTGSGAVMLAASPTTTGTLTAAAITASGVLTLSATGNAITSAGFIDITRSATNSGMFRTFVTGDTTERLNIRADGGHLYGPGNAGADLLTKREGVGIFAIRNTADSAYADFKANAITSSGIVTINAASGQGLTLANSYIDVNRPSGFGNLRVFAGYLTGDTQPRVEIKHQEILFGVGGSTAPDVNLKWVAADRLGTDDAFSALGGPRHATGSGTNSGLQAQAGSSAATGPFSGGTIVIGAGQNGTAGSNGEIQFGLANIASLGLATTHAKFSSAGLFSINTTGQSMTTAGSIAVKNVATGGTVSIAGDANGSIELGTTQPSPAADQTPYIDFHFTNAAGSVTNQDYNVRVINAVDNTLVFRYAAAGESQMQFGANAGGAGKAGVIWGSTGPVNLYRDSADLLKTDDSFHVGADFRHLGTNLGFYNTAATTRKTGYGAGAQIGTKAALTAGSTLNDVIAVLSSLVADLRAYGLVAS